MSAPPSAQVNPMEIGAAAAGPASGVSLPEVTPETALAIYGAAQWPAVPAEPAAGREALPASTFEALRDFEQAAAEPISSDLPVPSAALVPFIARDTTLPAAAGSQQPFDPTTFGTPVAPTAGLSRFADVMAYSFGARPGIADSRRSYSWP